MLTEGREFGMRLPLLRAGAVRGVHRRGVELSREPGAHHRAGKIYALIFVNRHLEHTAFLLASRLILRPNHDLPLQGSADRQPVCYHRGFLPGPVQWWPVHF